MEDAEWLSTEEMRAWRALIGAQYRLQRVLDLELQAAHGTTLQDHAVLIVLSEQPGGTCRMADLAEHLALSRSGLTRRIDGLVANGLVARERCSSDGRGVLARITDSGRQSLEAATPVHVAGVRRHFVDALAYDELAVVAEALEKVAPNASSPAGAPGALAEGAGRT